MPTVVIFSDASDGRISSGAGTTYSTVRSGTNLAVDTTQTFGNAGQWFLSPNYTMWQTFISFDTSTVTGTIASAVLNMTVNNNAAASQVYTTEVRAYDWGTSITTADWIPGANLGTYPLVASLISSTSNTNGVAYNFTDVALPANINQSGFTRLALSSDRMRLGTTPTTDEYLGWDLSETTGTTNDPHITLSSGATFIQQLKAAGIDTTSAQTKTTAGFDVLAGDTIVAIGMAMIGTTGPFPLTVSDSTTLTWTKRAEVQTGVTQRYVSVWTAPVPSDATGMTVTFTKGDATTSTTWVCYAQTWRGVSGVGVTGTSTFNNAPPAVTVTTQADHSALLMFVADNTAADTGQTYNNTIGTFTEKIGLVSLFSYAFYGGYYDDSGTAGSKTIGITYPANQVGAIAAVELLGGAGGGPPPAAVVTVDLYEAGSFVQTLGTFSVDTTGGVLVLPWDAATLTDISGDGVELRITSDVQVDIGAVEWNAAYSSGPATKLLASSTAGASTAVAALTVTAGAVTYVETWGMVSI